MVKLAASDAQIIYDSLSANQLLGVGIPRMDILKDKAWLQRDFAIVASDGNPLRIGQIISSEPPTSAPMWRMPMTTNQGSQTRLAWAYATSARVLEQRTKRQNMDKAR
jgi:hypothetical protein